MRVREDIEVRYNKTKSQNTREKIVFEVLLDIRELLLNISSKLR